MKVLYQIGITYTKICVGVSLNKRAVGSQEYCKGGLRGCSVTVSFQANLKCFPLKKNVDAYQVEKPVLMQYWSN